MRLFIVLLLLALPAQAALQQDETFKGSATFSGYWALGPMTINPFNRTCQVQLGLFWSSAAYDANPSNALALSEVYYIKGDDYDAIFPQGIPSDDMPKLNEILLDIYLYIKAQPDPVTGGPGYFSDAQLVP